MLELKKLAVKLARTPFVPLTKARVLRALRKRGLRCEGTSERAAVRTVFELACEIRRVRENRFFARYVRAIPDVRARLLRWRRLKARAAARENEAPIQAWAAIIHARFQRGGWKDWQQHISVETVKRRSGVRATGEIVAASRRRGIQVLRFKLPEDWLVRVHAPGLALLDGRLTLWAGRPTCVVRDGFRVEVRKAVWCRQGRDFTLLTEQGWIARLGDHTGHSVDADDAVRAVMAMVARERPAVKGARP